MHASFANLPSAQAFTFVSVCTTLALSHLFVQPFDEERGSVHRGTKGVTNVARGLATFLKPRDQESQLGDVLRSDEFRQNIIWALVREFLQTNHHTVLHDSSVI